MYVYVCTCMTLCTHVHAVPTEAGRGNQIPPGTEITKSGEPPDAGLGKLTQVF